MTPTIKAVTFNPAKYKTAITPATTAIGTKTINEVIIESKNSRQKYFFPLLHASPKVTFLSASISSTADKIAPLAVIDK